MDSKRYPPFTYLLEHLDETLLSNHELSLTIQIAEAVRQNGGRALVVGGYPRDLVMHQTLGKHLETKDVDLEVYGLTLEALQDVLRPIHAVNTVGASFGVLKVGPLDVSLPRTDIKSGSGHRGFNIQADPTLSHAQAARRRDFTINTLALDPLTGELFDEYQAVQDIAQKTLRAVDPATFGDDPLRALRAMQFAGRFEFTVEPATAELCRNLDLTELSRERVGEEWIKLLTKSERPSIGLVVARDLGIIRQLHPELQALIDTPQEAEWHPEGDVWNHSLMAADVAAGIVRREGLPHAEALPVMFGALCHDFGKPLVTAYDETTGRIRSPEHARAGVEVAEAFMNSLSLPESTVRKVKRLVFDHMFLPEVSRARDAAIRRLAKRLHPATVQELIWVTEADFCGRSLKNSDTSLISLFQKRATELAVMESAVEPLIQGRDLLPLGVQPGRHMGDLLHKLETAQLDGQFATHEEGIAYYRQHLAG